MSSCNEFPCISKSRRHLLYLRGYHPLYLSFAIKYISIWTKSKVLFHFVNNYKENHMKYPNFCFFRWYLNPITHIGVRNTTKLIIGALFWTECRCFGVSLFRKGYHSEEKRPVVSFSYYSSSTLNNLVNFFNGIPMINFVSIFFSFICLLFWLSSY